MMPRTRLQLTEELEVTLQEEPNNLDNMPTRGSSAWLFGAMVSLVIITAWSYGNTLENGFHYDDDVHIVENQAVHATDLTLPLLSEAWTKAILKTRSLAYVTFAIDWQRGGGSPQAFQATNLSIHLLTSVAVMFLLMMVLGRNEPNPSREVIAASFVGALLWSIHPIQVQPVTYIVQRMTLLATIFVILCLLSYLKWRFGHRMRHAWLLASILFAGLGCLSKEIAWIIPFLLLLAEIGVVRHEGKLFRGRLDFLWILVPAAPIILLIADRAAGLGLWATYVDQGYVYRDFTLGERLLTEPRVIFFHFSQMFWPDPERFAIVHELPVSRSLWEPATTALSLAGITAIAAAGFALLGKKTSRGWGFFILWVPLTLVIESSVIPLRIIFEHRFYLPSIGLVGLLALVVHRVLERHPLSRWFVFVMTLALTILLSASTVKRIAVWRDDPTLWGDVLKKYPCSAEAHNALGTYSWRRGLVRKARDHYLAALQCDPRHRQAVLNLARAYRDLGDFANAIEAYRNASVLRPNDPTVRFSLGLAYLETGMGTLAAEEFRKVLEMDPNHPHARGFLEFASSLDSRSPHGIVSPHP